MKILQQAIKNPLIFLAMGNLVIRTLTYSPVEHFKTMATLNIS